MEPTRVGVLVDRTDPAALAAGLQVVLADEADRRRGGTDPSRPAE
ncbi:hypothetical protein [Salinibacter ruber]|nr:hypothetical protein [Salinibacter ruber]MCS4142583.1 hypothetical protein [Salinibacter ruber]MCS4155836.1 hypothetical protein [Salinibacter ruber]